MLILRAMFTRTVRGNRQRVDAAWRWTAIVAGGVILVCAAESRAQTAVDLREATVKRSDGTVQIVEKNGAVSEANVDAVLSAGQTLRTGANGSAEIALKGSGAVRVEMDSEVKLPETKDKTASQESLQMLFRDSRFLH